MEGGAVRGWQDPQVSMLAFIDLEARVPADHPPRVIRRLADEALAGLSPLFDQIYAASGRPSVPPERLLKASLLIRCTRFAPNGPSASSWSTTCCSAGFPRSTCSR